MKRITTIFALLMLVCMGAWAQETTVWFKQANDGDNVTRGTYYNKDGTVNTNAGSFVYFWKSGADEPIITLKATNNPQDVGVMAREHSRLTANGNPTYEISVSEGYIIKSYYIKFINFNDASKPKTLAATEFGQSATTQGSERNGGSPVDAEVTVTNVNKAATTFTVSSDDDKAIKIREFYVVVEETSDYTDAVEAEIKPWVESAGKGFFTLDPEDAAVAQVISSYNAGPAGKTWTKDEYDALKAALQKALGAEAYLLPETGYYHVRNKIHKTYIGYGTIQGKGSGLTLYANTDDPSTTLLFTKIGANSYTIRTTAGNVGQAPTNATDQLYPVEGSGEKFQFVVIDAAQGLFTLTCGEFPNPRNASLTLGYLHGTNWGGVVSWTRDGDASHWTIEKASGPVVPPVVDPVNTELQLAINVLNNVPYALYPPTFDWDAPRAYKEYKNTYGRYQLASRLAVAILARLVDYATAEDDVKAKIAKDLADKYDIANFDAVLNDLLKSYARKVVETHGEAYALYEQGDENFSRMYDALAQAGVTDTEQYAAFWATGTNDPYGDDIEKTLSDAYELLVAKLKDPKPFDTDLTAHIVNPNFQSGTSGWNITEWGTDSGKPLTDSEGNTRPYNNYLNSWNKSNVIVDANQELTLPAGRYMLTVAGRGSSDHYREVSAANPEEFFQVYATNNQGITRAQSIYPLEEEGEDVGVFGNGWNDASVFFTMPSAGKAIVGVRAKTKVGRHWVSATRFRLTRVGDPTLIFDENQTYDVKLEYDPIFEQLNQLAPVDVVLHKKMEAGKWYAMSLPANITKEQLAEKFGSGTRVAQLVNAKKNEDGAYLYFNSLPIETANYYATCPFLIKPEKVRTDNTYVFHNVVGRQDYVSGGVDRGEYSMSSAAWDGGGWGPGGSHPVRIVSNYTYNTAFDGVAVEMGRTLKAFSAYMEADDAEIVALIMDNGDELLDQQLEEAAVIGSSLSGRYTGIPEAMVKALAMSEKPTIATAKAAALKNFRIASSEAAKAVAPSKEFRAAYAEAEELLASEHTELVSGADAAFKELLATHLASFNQTMKAEEIPALTEKLREEIEKYKTQIDQGLVELESGKFVFYNIGSKKYLNGSNNWGTQASLTAHGDMMDLTRLDDGRYTIETRFLSSKEGMFGKDSQGVYYMDINTGATKLEIVPVKPGVYTINDGNGYLGYNGENTVLGTGLTDAKNENAQWLILSEDDFATLMAEANVKNPVDVTHLIKDANFSRNHVDLNAWAFSWDGGNGRLSATTTGYENQSDKHANFSAEAWKATFDLSQELEVPNGVYVVEAQGAVTDYTGAYDGTDYPVFFANGVTSPFVSMEEEHRAKDMFTLQKSFLDGMYFVNPIVVKVTDGQLTVGAKGTRTDLWATWDNFSLKFYGNANIDDVKQLYDKTTGNDTNGIDTVDSGQLTVDGWYSIDGVKLNGKPTKKGVYIVNGKKVIVK